MEYVVFSCLFIPRPEKPFPTSSKSMPSGRSGVIHSSALVPFQEILCFSSTPYRLITTSCTTCPALSSIVTSLHNATSSTVITTTV